MVDDHEMMRDLFTRQLERCEPPRFEVIGTEGDAERGIELCLRTRPDLLILDLLLATSSGLEVFRALKTRMPWLKVLFISGSRNTRLIGEAIALGADGFITKPQPWSKLVEAIDQIVRGRKSFDPSVVQRESPCLPVKRLTKRENQLAQLIANGCTSKEIAVQLKVSPKTVDNHRTNMMRKLQVHDVAGVTRYAISSGLSNIY